VSFTQEIHLQKRYLCKRRCNDFVLYTSWLSFY